jgi:dienelactone hydrolase
VLNASGNFEGLKTMMSKPVQTLRPLVRAASSLLLATLLAALAVPAFAVEGVFSEAGPLGPSQTAYPPDKGPGPVVIVISGQTGPAAYQKYAADLAAFGYYAVLLTGKDILNPDHTGEGNLRKAIERAQQSPSAVRGKAAVVGFSLGGGGALYNAAPLSDLVSMVVAYYPYTLTWADKMDGFVKRFRVPVLVMPGGLDRYHNCCVIESMRSMEAAAQKNGARFELVVYPDANHGFNLETSASGEPAGAYRREDDRDAWTRTLAMLKRYQPLR